MGDTPRCLKVGCRCPQGRCLKVWSGVRHEGRAEVEPPPDTRVWDRRKGPRKQQHSCCSPARAPPPAPFQLAPPARAGDASGSPAGEQRVLEGRCPPGRCRD
eukprot:15470585-Alexandrium_andersonii.AAC.2